MLDFRKPYVLMTKEPKEKSWFGDDDNLPMIAIKCICERGRKEYSEHTRKMYLQYYDIGCERGHRLEGKVAKELPNGIIFKWAGHDQLFKLTEMTMDEFERRVRPTLDEYQSRYINDLDDVYVWYRKQAGIV